MGVHYTKALDNRLAAVEGHVAAIRRMMQADRQCEEILNQLSAAESSLNKVAKIVLKDHLNHCVRESIERGEPDALSDFSAMLDKYL